MLTTRIHRRFDRQARGRSEHHWTAAIAVVLVALSASACGASDTSLQIGLRRISLELAFTDEDASPDSALRPTPVPGQIEVAILEPGESFGRGVTPGFNRPVRLPCPGPADDAVPAAPVDIEINKPVEPGRHATRVSGYYVVEGGAVDVMGPLPEISQFLIRNVVTGQDANGARSDSFEVYRPGLGESFSVTTYRLTNSELQLAKTLTKTSGGESAFTPRPTPVLLDTRAAVAVDAQGTGMGGQIVGKDGAGNTWTTSGTDPSTGASSVIEGVVVSRDRVELCNEVVEAWRVETSERFVDLRQGVVSETTDIVGDCRPSPSGQACAPSKNVRWIATQHGALVVREDLHMRVTQGGTTTWIEKSEIVDETRPAPIAEGG